MVVRHCLREVDHSVGVTSKRAALAETGVRDLSINRDRSDLSIALLTPGYGAFGLKFSPPVAHSTSGLDAIHEASGNRILEGPGRIPSWDRCRALLKRLTAQRFVPHSRGFCSAGPSSQATDTAQRSVICLLVVFDRVDLHEDQHWNADWGSRAANISST